MKYRSLRLVELDAAEKRVDAMMQAVQALRAPLDTFSNSLTEEQKRRLDSWANRGGHNKAGETITQLCSDTAAEFTNLPSEQIQQTVQPKEQQMPAFEALKAASNKGSEHSKRHVSFGNTFHAGRSPRCHGQAAQCNGPSAEYGATCASRFLRLTRR